MIVIKTISKDCVAAPIRNEWVLKYDGLNPQEIMFVLTHWIIGNKLTLTDLNGKTKVHQIDF